MGSLNSCPSGKSDLTKRNLVTIREPMAVTLADCDHATAILALREIASTSPVCRHLPNGTEERCIHCRALIDRAREALGQQPWPASTVRP